MSRIPQIVAKPTDSELLEILYQYNPWWTSNQVKAEKTVRSDFFKVKDRMQDSEILGLVGPRRIGKTVLLYQLIRELLTQNKRVNILFLSMDHSALRLTGDLGRILNIYATDILKKSFQDLTEKVFILLDEIQSFHNWESTLKTFYDLGYNMKFVVSGSSSTNILEGASKALTGRIHPQIMLPIKLRDYLKFRITHDPYLPDKLRISSKNMRNSLKESLQKKSARPFYEQAQKEFKNLIAYKDKILAELNNYFLYGGYPKIVFNPDREKAKEYLDDYVYLTLSRDIRSSLNLKNIDTLRDLFYLLCRTSPHTVNRSNLSDVLKIERSTVANYITALKSAFLISEANAYSKTVFKGFRKERKVYSVDIGIRNLYSNSMDEKIFTNNSKLGEIAEIVAATHTNRLVFNLEGTSNSMLYYWRESQQGSEVDIVVTPLNSILPVEVKYQQSISGSDLNGLRKFNNKFGTSFSIMITKNELDIVDQIVKIPIWLYLIMC